MVACAFHGTEFPATGLIDGSHGMWMLEIELGSSVIVVNLKRERNLVTECFASVVNQVCVLPMKVRRYQTLQSWMVVSCHVTAKPLL